LGLRWGFETTSRNAPVFEHGLVALDIGKWSWCHWQMIPHAKLESAGCCLFQLTTRKFDVKKNSFLRKDLIGP
jgi:hypothetical protein